MAKMWYQDEEDDAAVLARACLRRAYERVPQNDGGACFDRLLSRLDAALRAKAER